VMGFTKAPGRIAQHSPARECRVSVAKRTESRQGRHESPESRLRIHIVFSTKDRPPTIPRELIHRLWAYIAGIIKKLGVKSYAIGGTSDPIHIFIGLPATANLAEIVQKIKANSSRWVHKESNVVLFAWQEGYAAFSVSMSHSETTIGYIDNQARHHERKDFKTEMDAILEKRGTCAVPTGT
jgi:putative transposase